MQIQQTARVVQADDYPLQFILFILMDKRKYSVKSEMEKRKCCLIQRTINLQNVLLQGDTENKEVSGIQEKMKHMENENSYDYIK